jgi:hypothetical protein
VVRRLPVVQTPSSEDAEAHARSPLQWVVIGAGFTITLWLPLATLAAWLESRALVMLSFIIAATLAGVLLGKFGLRARLGHVALAGLLGGTLGFLLAALGGGLSGWVPAVATWLILAGTGAAFAAGGGLLGRRLRGRPG